LLDSILILVANASTGDTDVTTSCQTYLIFCCYVARVCLWMYCC